MTHILKHSEYFGKVFSKLDYTLECHHYVSVKF